MRRYLLGIVACLLSTTLLAADPPAPTFRAGAATSNITPALGSAIIGGFLPFPATNVHDELHARCLVLDDGKTKLALVVVDLLGIHYNVSHEARKFIEQEVGIPSTNVLISAIHNHSAASALGEKHFEFPQKIDDYQAFVARRIADGVKCAANRLRPAQVGFTTAQAPEHVFNRRWFLKPGAIPPGPFGTIDQVKMNPAAGSPDLVKPAGPTDPVVSILAVASLTGGRSPCTPAIRCTTWAAWSTATFQPTTTACTAGAGALLEGDQQDPPMVAMMANGTSGDVNNINFLHPRPPKKPYEQMRFVADGLAASPRPWPTSSTRPADAGRKLPRAGDRHAPAQRRAARVGQGNVGQAGQAGRAPRCPAIRGPGPRSASIPARCKCCGSARCASAACPTRSSARSASNSASGAPCSPPSWSPWPTAFRLPADAEAARVGRLQRPGWPQTAWSRRPRRSCSTPCWKWRPRSVRPLKKLSALAPSKRRALNDRRLQETPAMKSSVLALVACSLTAATLCAAPPASGFRAGAPAEQHHSAAGAADCRQFHRPAVNQRAR